VPLWQASWMDDFACMSAKSHKIALVEDSTDTAELFTEFLSRFCDDLKVDSFHTGRDFLEVFARGIYCIVVLDISLPEMDGYEVLRRIRLIDPYIPAIAVTAHAGTTDRQKVTNAGFNALITKPVGDLDAFCQTIVDFIRAH
jgi:CheY-like chemotaxis protein